MIRRMYLDPAENLAPHVGVHDENEFCEWSVPKCIVFSDERDDPAWKTPPEHYVTGSGIQPWDVIDSFDLDFYSGNALKYILRAGKKDIAPRLDDLKKAANYIAKAIDREENRE